MHDQEAELNRVVVTKKEDPVWIGENVITYQEQNIFTMGVFYELAENLAKRVYEKGGQKTMGHQKSGKNLSHTKSIMKHLAKSGSGVHRGKRNILGLANKEEHHDRSSRY